MKSRLILTVVLVGILFSLMLNTMNVAAEINDIYVVGGTIVPIDSFSLLGPWIGGIAILSLLIVAVFWRGRKVL